MHALVLSFLVGCGGEAEAPEHTLRLEGPERVRVDELGPVSLPSVVLDDGTVAEGLTWTVGEGSVAKVQGTGVVAVAPGEVEVTGTWQGQTVTWTLVVDPAMNLHIEGARATLAVGDTLALRGVGSIGDTSVDPGAVAWSSSDAEILSIGADGAATALAPGRVWVSGVTGGGSKATVEIDVQ